MTDPNATPDDGNAELIVVNVDNKSQTPPSYTPPDIKMAEALPPEFRDKPYFKDKTFVDVIKEHDGLQKLLGQRPAGIPKEDAPDEEWNKFLGAIKPKSADEYALPETEFSKATPRSEEYVKAVKELFYGADISKKQAAKLTRGIEAFLAKAQGTQESAKAEADTKRAAEFEGLLDKTYGANKQTVIDRTKKMMSELVDPSIKESISEVLKEMPNDVLFAVTTILDGVHKKYLSEDGVPGTNSNAGGDINSWQAEAEQTMRSPEYRDFRLAGHDTAKQKVAELFSRIAAAQKR
jgi:hypothetical protein